MTFDAPAPFFSPPPTTTAEVGGAGSAAAAVDAAASAQLAMAGALLSPGSGTVPRGRQYGLELAVALSADGGAGAAAKHPLMLACLPDLAAWLVERMSAAAQGSLARLATATEALRGGVCAGAGVAPATRERFSSWRALLADDDARAHGAVAAMHGAISGAVERYFDAPASAAAAAPPPPLAPAAALPAVPASLHYELPTDQQMALVKDVSTTVRAMQQALEDQADEVSRALEASAHSLGAASRRDAGAGPALASSPPPPPPAFAARALGRRFARRLITPLAVMRVLLGHATPLFPPAAFRDAPAAGGAGEPPGTLGAPRRGGGLWARYAGRDLVRLARAVTGVLQVELLQEEAAAADADFK